MNKKDLFKDELLNGSTIKDACKKIAISETQAYKWLNGGLREELRDVNKQRFCIAISRLESESDTMIKELIDAIKNERSPPMLTAKAKAIQIYFQIRNESVSDEILERIDALENTLNKRGN